MWLLVTDHVPHGDSNAGARSVEQMTLLRCHYHAIPAHMGQEGSAQITNDHVVISGEATWPSCHCLTLIVVAKLPSHIVDGTR